MKKIKILIQQETEKLYSFLFGFCFNYLVRVMVIPFSQYESWMHQRIPLKRESRAEISQRWLTQPKSARIADAILSRFFQFLNRFGKNIDHVLYKLITKIGYIYFRLHNRLKVYGLENIPPNGGIFYVNHPGQMDPALLAAALPFQIGGLIAWGNGWAMDKLEYRFGLLSLRHNKMVEVVERIVRQILLKNRFFAIWPEGHPTYKRRLEEGHSSIVRVYAVLNSLSNKIPFIPVLIRGAQCFRIKEHTWKAEFPNLKPTMPIEVHFFPPIFLERTWLAPPDHGGKTPREIIDYLMLQLASKQKQTTLDRNPLLDWRRSKHAQKQKITSPEAERGN